MKKIIFCYCSVLFFLTIFSYLFTDPNLSYLKSFYSGFANNNRLLTTVLYISFILILFLFYAIFLGSIKKGKFNASSVKLLIGISLILILAYPAMLSYDIFNYIATAKVSFFYKENPYLIMPIEFPNDPFFIFTRATNKIALYGPFWIALTSIPFLLGFGNFLLILLNFKILIAVFYIGTNFLIWKFSKNLFSVVFFALNPLVLIEILLGAHNDIVMVFLALLAFYILEKNERFKSLLFLFLSILIKYATLFLLPIYVYSFIMKVKKNQINWEKVFYISALLMIIIFFLSPIREEIYPWYAVWFLAFAALIPKRKLLLYFSYIMSFTLLLRDIPYMLLGTYFGLTPLIKMFVTLFPIFIFILYYLFFPKFKTLFKGN